MALVAAALAVSGCGGPLACEKPGRYVQARQAPPVQVPEDLDEVDSDGQWDIPMASAPPPPPDEPNCLERPPKY